MNIFITGATGFVGSVLTAKLAGQHQITALTRSPEKAGKILPASVKTVSTLACYANFDEFDAVINLAGEPIFDRRWTAQQKERLTNSRVNLTENLTALINNSVTPPHTFISGSACGYYGDCGEQPIDENTPPSDAFPAKLCQQWEAAALNADTRVCVLRTGIVMDKSGGALARMLPLYRYGLGGKLGCGKQFWAWIALPDMINAIEFLLLHSTCQGAFNLVSPHPIRNAEFNRMLGLAVKRPHFATVPAFVLKLVLGERSQLLLDSQNVQPSKLLAAGFEFQLPTLQQALSESLK